MGKVGSPAIDAEWLYSNKKNFKPEACKIGEAVLFHDIFSNRGPNNLSSKLRTSFKFKILILK